MVKDINVFFDQGCGRCKHFQTPSCKVHTWQMELEVLRSISLNTELQEEMKWGFPCYTDKGKNIFSIAPFKNHCSINFFKGGLLMDKENVLQKAGENSNSMRIIRFNNVDDILRLKEQINDLIKQAVEIERSGKKIESLKVNTEYPDELSAIFEKDKIFNESFSKLTPGRQRGYLLFFSSAKQSKTITDRILKNRERIVSGKGLHD